MNYICCLNIINILYHNSIIIYSDTTNYNFSIQFFNHIIIEVLKEIWGILNLPDIQDMQRVAIIPYMAITFSLGGVTFFLFSY